VEDQEKQAADATPGEHGGAEVHGGNAERLKKEAGGGKGSKRKSKEQLPHRGSRLLHDVHLPSVLVLWVAGSIKDAMFVRHRCLALQLAHIGKAHTTEISRIKCSIQCFRAVARCNSLFCATEDRRV